MCVTLRCFGIKSSVLFFFFSKCGSGRKDEEHAKGEMHSGMSAGVGVGIGGARKEVKAVRRFCLRKSYRVWGRGTGAGPSPSPALCVPGGVRRLILVLASLILTRITVSYQFLGLPGVHDHQCGVLSIHRECSLVHICNQVGEKHLRLEQPLERYHSLLHVSLG